MKFENVQGLATLVGSIINCVNVLNFKNKVIRKYSQDQFYFDVSEEPDKTGSDQFQDYSSACSVLLKVLPVDEIVKQN